MPPDPSESASFFATATAAPVTQAEVAPNATPPAAPAATPTPETKPSTPPASTPEPPKTPETKPEPAKTEPTKAADEKIETKVDGPITQDPEKVKAAPTATQVEEQDLTKEEIAQIGKMTPKELRAVFKARNAAEAAVRKLQPENEMLQKQVKEMATLKATIVELEKRPTTEANDARIAAANKELETRKTEIERIETEVRGREEKVKPREYATDVQKTEDYQKYITVPTQRLMSDLKMLCLGAADSEEEGNAMHGQIEKVLAIEDPAARWRELKRIIADVDPADKAAFRKVHDDWNVILTNYDQLAKNAEQAKKTVENDQKRQAELRAKDSKERVALARKAVRPELEKEVPFLTMDLEGHPAYKKLRDDGLKQMEEFDPATATPETISALNDMAIAFQLAARVSKDYIKQQGEDLTKLTTERDDWKKKFEDLQAEKKKEKDDEEEEEQQASDVSPTVSGGRESAALPTFVPGGAPNGVPGKFSEAVYTGKDR